MITEKLRNIAGEHALQDRQIRVARNIGNHLNVRTRQPLVEALAKQNIAESFLATEALLKERFMSLIVDRPEYKQVKTQTPSGNFHTHTYFAPVSVATLLSPDSEGRTQLFAYPFTHSYTKYVDEEFHTEDRDYGFQIAAAQNDGTNEAEIANSTFSRSSNPEDTLSRPHDIDTVLATQTTFTELLDMVTAIES